MTPRAAPVLVQSRTPDWSRPVVSTVLMDGRLALKVALKGSLGAGPSMIVDEWEWEHIALAQGDRWGLKEARPGYFYVVSRGAQRGLVLARWLCRAKAGECVAYTNGDRLDLRRANLATVPEAVFRARVLGRDLDAA